MDRYGQKQTVLGGWSVKPDQKAYLLDDDKPIFASKVHFTVTSKLGEKRWVSAPNNVDADGNLILYHARPASHVFYKNTEATSVTIRGTSYIDDQGQKHTGTWTWRFQPGESAKLLIDNKPILASRFDYTTIGGSSQKAWYNEYEDFTNKEQFVCSGGVGDAVVRTAFKPVAGNGIDQKTRDRIIGKLIGALVADAFQDAALADEDANPFAQLIVAGLARGVRSNLIEEAVVEATPGQSAAVRSAMATVIGRMFDGDFNPKSLQREVLEAEIIRELKRHNNDAANFVEGVDFLADLFEEKRKAQRR